MDGFSAKLPIMYSKEDGVYTLNKTILDTIRQNLKMLLLTVPGERITDIKFGVGLRRYLFSQDTDELRGAIRANIYDQVRKYLSYITIIDVIFSPSGSSVDNVLSISIRYTVSGLNINDELNINS
jgi:phage baseplate assembly protein W